MSENAKITLTEEVTDKIFTAPNVISFVRLCMVPVYLVLLFAGHNVAACIIFAVAAGTDFIDGQIARRTHCVSKLGQILDPAVDGLLMISGVAGVYIVGRLPLWIIIYIIVRYLYLIGNGAFLLKRYQIRIPVIFPGKVSTTLLFTGFAALLLNMPVLQGLGVVDVSWLPGLCAGPYGWGIWFVYAGVAISFGVTVYYTVRAAQELRKALAKAKDAASTNPPREG